MGWRSTMVGVINKFFVASICMCAAPIAILYGFRHNLLPGKPKLSIIVTLCSTGLSSESMTLWSGMLAVISINPSSTVIAFYIYMAMKEPSDKHKPDAKFLADARASIKQSGRTEADSPSVRAKLE
ncbi:hypothetical protein BUALT_Bualt08G0135300 [Buddleja alternifolia]|uniref:PIN-like protein n=1 Tax=Buddleja alternifolia TaxID=168488 RepID=A0AAV6X7L5_9LAMI|nr:hypothetical protein BUALT_Bualt08G0135300 [Buddleja alternifolia]